MVVSRRHRRLLLLLLLLPPFLVAVKIVVLFFRKNNKRLNLKPKRTKTALFFNELPWLEDFEDDEDVKRGTQKEGNRTQSDWLDASQELDLFNTKTAGVPCRRWRKTKREDKEDKEDK